MQASWKPVKSPSAAAPFIQLKQFNNTNGPSLQIFKAAVSVAAGTLVVKLFSMVKEMVTAAVFGTSSAMDCFVLALAVPSYIINVTAGSLNSALIPTYTEVRMKEGEESARRLLANVLAMNTLLLVFLALLVSCFVPELMNFISGATPDKEQLLEQLLLILLPTVVLSGSTVVLSSVANTRNRFLSFSLVGAVVPAAIIAVVLLNYKGLGIHSLALGTLCGFLLELLLVLVLLKRLGIKPSFEIKKIHPRLKTIVWQYIPVLSGSSLVCSSQLVDQGMSAFLGSGSVASLNYGIKLTAVLSGISTMALGTALLPHFSAMSAKNDWAEIRRTLRNYILIILGASIPISLIIAFYSEAIVQLLFQRGAFSPEDTKLVAQVQAVSVLQLPFISLAILFIRLGSSLKMNQLLLFSNVIGVTLNIGLNYLFMRYWGLVGIALSTVIVYLVSCLLWGAFIFVKLHRQNRIEAEDPAGI